MKRLLVVMVLAGVAVWAQGPRGPRPMGMGPGDGMGVGNLDAVKSALGLSDAQVAQLKQIRKDTFTANEGLRTQMREKQQSLHTAMKSDNPDGSAMAAALRDLQTLRTQMKAKHDDLAKATRAVLTPQQATQLASLEQAMKLVPAARQATALGLITPSDNAGAAMIMGGRGPGAAPMGGRMRRTAPPVQ